MEQFYELEGLQPKIGLDETLKGMDCYEDSPVYEEVVDEYHEIYDSVMEMLSPVGVMGFGELPKEIETEKYKAGTQVLYVVTSVGKAISAASTQAFASGDYVRGMLYDAMADAALFSLEQIWQKQLRKVCADHETGILRRLEAPQDISMESQKVAWEYLHLQERFGIGISSGYMYDPVKTTCQIFILTQDTGTFKSQHDCRNCPNVTCRHRNIPKTELTVTRGDVTEKIAMKAGESALDALVRGGFFISAPCGGKGRCGKCRIKILSGDAPVSEEDKKSLDQAELAAGYRLACCLFPKDDLEILLDLPDESEFDVVGDILEKQKQEPREYAQSDGRMPSAGRSDGRQGDVSSADAKTNGAWYDVAVDIGTTTVAMELLDGETGNILHTVTFINGQRAYGADVISRIQASVEGKKEALKNSIRKDLFSGFCRLMQESGISSASVRRIAVGANTTMVHLLMGYDCDTLGVYPFTPVNIGLIKSTFGELFGSDLCDAEVTVLPGISTYVGGDIVSGLYACGFDETDEISMLIDLGTNGEMAVGRRGQIYTASTAAGPAFEGGNIEWGTGSIPGAICAVEIGEDQTVFVRTIQDREPAGICGTGVVETASELVRCGIVEPSGLLDEEYFEEGFPLATTKSGENIVFTQKDVREIQLAKAAVRAGIETLLLRYKVEKEQVAHVCVAGGFGFRLDVEKAFAIGMLPEEFRGKIRTVGNSSLSGAARYLTDSRGEDRMDALVGMSTEISLSADPDFQEFYMEYMMFGEE